MSNRFKLKVSIRMVRASNRKYLVHVRDHDHVRDTNFTCSLLSYGNKP